MAVYEAGQSLENPAHWPMSDATAHHEAGHAAACEHFGVGWVIHGPNDEENHASELSRSTSERLFRVRLESVALIAMAGWAAESHFLESWTTHTSEKVLPTTSPCWRTSRGATRADH